MKKILSILLGLLILPTIASAQITAPVGGTGLTTYAAGDMIYAGSANPLRFTKLNIGINGTCLTSNGSIPVWGTCGGGSSFAWPFDVHTSYVSTSTVIGLNGFFSTASSTISGPFRLPSVSNGGLAVFSGLVSSFSTTTASCAGNTSCTSFTVLGSSPITITGAAASLSPFATTTVSGQGVIYPTDTMFDFMLGRSSTTTAPFWWDVNATTTYIGNGGTGDSVVTVGPTNFLWTLGYDATDNSFAIASSSVLGTNNALTIAKGGNSTTTLTGLNIAGSATSTSNVGFNITTGCYAVNGTCATGTGGSSSQGPINVLQASNGSGGFIATGTPSLTAGYFLATSTTATSTMANSLSIGLSATGQHRLTVIPSSSQVDGSGFSTGGAVYIDTTNTGGSALNLHTSFGSGAGGRLLNGVCDNNAFDQECINFQSFAVNSTVLNVIASSTGKGGVKIATQSTNGGAGGTYDQNASALSIDLKGNNSPGTTAAQGIFLNSTGSTTGDLIQWRQQDIQLGQLDSLGWLGLATTTRGAGPLSIGGIANFSAPTSTLYVGLNLKKGCYAINGTCISGSGGSTAPGSPVNSIQFNNAGSFGGSSNFTFDGTSIVATPSGNISLSPTGSLSLNPNAGLTLTSNGSQRVNIDTSGLTSDRNVAFPDADGTLCLTTTCTGGGSDPFTHPAAGVSATTSLMLLYGQASSTLFSANTGFFNFVNATSTTATSTFTNAIQIGGTTGSNMLKITAPSTSTASITTGGVVNIRQPFDGSALTVWKTGDASDNGRGIVLNQDGVSDAQDFILASSSASGSTLINLKGAPTGKGILKIEHTGGSGGTGFSNAALFSGDVLGDDAQGIFLTSTLATTTGNPLTIRNFNNQELFTFKANGLFGLSTSSPFAELSIQGINTATTTVSVKPTANQTADVLDVNYNSGLALQVVPGGFGTTTLSGLNVNGSATTTSNVGFNITAGCYARGGVCIGGSGSGTVTSVGLSLPTGFTVTNSPVTTTGTLTGTLASGYSIKELPSIVVAAAGGDTTSIQTALTTCGSLGGGNIYLTDSSYAQGATGLTWRGSNCHIIGRGMGTTTITFTGATTLFKTNSAVSTYAEDSIQDLTITADGNTSGIAIDWSDMTHGMVENIKMDNIGRAIRLNDTQNITFYNTFQHIDATTITNIGIDASSTNPVNSNYFNDIFLGSSASNIIGMQMNNSNGNKINLLRVEPGSVTGTVGLKFFDSTLATNDGVFENVVDACYIEANGTGLSIPNAVGPGGGIKRNVISNCMIESNTTDFSFGSDALSKNTLINITDSTFTNPNTTFQGPFGINTNGQRSIFNIFTPSFGAPAMQIYNNSSFAENATNYVEMGLINAGDSANLLDLQNKGTGATIISTTTSFILKANGALGIGTTTPIFPLQVTSTSTNATSTLELGKSGQNKGSCMKLYRTDGSAIYAYVGASATTFTLSTTACN